MHKHRCFFFSLNTSKSKTIVSELHQMPYWAGSSNCNKGQWLQAGVESIWAATLYANRWLQADMESNEKLAISWLQKLAIRCMLQTAGCKSAGCKAFLQRGADCKGR
jgi:hypothetical protein